MSSDDDLLIAWRSGDQRAGQELFERHYDAIDRFFRNKVGESAGRDLAQKTFLGCLESVERDRYQSRGSFRSWLFAIAYRQLCKHWRNSKREQERFDFGTVSAFDLDPTPSSLMVRSQEERLLLEALRQIPVDMQVALELRYWEQMSDTDIAAALDTPLGTIKSRLRRARIILGERMEKLASSSEQLDSTLGNLEGWAASLRKLV